MRLISTLLLLLVPLLVAGLLRLCDAVPPLRAMGDRKSRVMECRSRCSSSCPILVDLLNEEEGLLQEGSAVEGLSTSTGFNDSK